MNGNQPEPSVATRDGVLAVEASSLLRSLSRHSAVRFLAVGGLSVVVDAGLLVLLHGVLAIWLPVAAALAFAGAFVVNFGLNRAWVFGSAGAVHRQLVRYLTLVAVNLVLTVILVPALTWLGLPYLVAKLVTTGALAVLNYLASRTWIFG